MTYDECKQSLSWEPKIEGAAPPSAAPRVVVGGMGGSALPGNALRFLDSSADVFVHRGYDLPMPLPENALYVAISYSGNTEETLSFAKAAHEKGLPLAAIASGGALEKFAVDTALPFVRVPGGIQPRSALFFQLRAFLALIGRDDLLAALANASFDETAAEQQAKTLAEALPETLPHFYASRENAFLSWVAKINCNEGAKTPAYANVFSELNHNEMQSFDTAAPADIVDRVRFVLLRSKGDDPRIAKRMNVFSDVMRERGRTVLDLPLVGTDRASELAYGWFVMHRFERIFSKMRDADPDSVPLIEDFKKRLSS